MCWNFPFQKKDINFYKIFSWEKFFIKSPYHKRKKKGIPPAFSNHPHPTPPKESFFGKKFKSHLHALKNNQISPSHATQETTLWVNPHPKKIHLPQSIKKNLLWKGVELPILLSSPKKTLLKKEKIKILIPHSLFLKLHL